MSRGSGLTLGINETNQQKINQTIRQLAEGRSNAVGTVTLTHDGVAMTTQVTSTTCGANAVVILTPQTAHAAAVLSSTYVQSVAPGQFTVAHSTTTLDDETFGFFCVG